MKKMLSLFVALLLLAAFPAALAEEFLYIPALDGMNYLSGEAFGDEYAESYLTEDGLVLAEVLTFAAFDVGLVGEDNLAELMELRADGDMQDLQEVSCGEISLCPAQRVRFVSGSDEDGVVVDATAIWADGATFVVIFTVDTDAWYGFMDGYEDGIAPALIDEWLSEIQIGSHDLPEEDAAAGEANDYGFHEEYVDTEFFRVGIPESWQGLYVCEVVYQEPFGYIVFFSEQESGFVFSLEARWFDDQTVQLASVWEAYLGRMGVDRLGYLDLLVTYSQYAPDASDAWHLMYDTCRDVVDTILLQEGVVLEAGEYLDYQP